MMRVMVTKLFVKVSIQIDFKTIVLIYEMFLNVCIVSVIKMGYYNQITDFVDIEHNQEYLGCFIT